MKNKQKEEEQEEEEYLKYIIKDCTINITVEDGGMFVMQSGNPHLPPPPPKP